MPPPTSSKAKTARPVTPPCATSTRRLRPPLHNYWRPQGPLVEWLSKESLPRLGRTPAEAASLSRLFDALVAFERSGKLAIPLQDSDPKTLAALDRESFDSYLRRR